MLATEMDVDNLTQVECSGLADALVVLTDQIELMTVLVDVLHARAEGSREVRAMAVALDMHKSRLLQVCHAMERLA